MTIETPVTTIGVLGGTFDPPHLGHLGVAHSALASELIDQVWFVPVLAHRLDKTPVSFDDRVAMSELLIAGRVNLRVLTIERELTHPGRTLELVNVLQERYPRYTFRLLVGTDIYFEREKWHLWDDIAALAPPVYVERQGVGPIPHPTLPAPPPWSSSGIRRALARGEDVSQAVPSAVLSYIHEHELYR